MSLSSYVEEVSDLLHDTSNRFNNQRQITRYINESRTKVARTTGCVRRLLTGQSAFGAGAQAGSLIPGAGQPGSLPGAFPNSQNSTAVGPMQTIPGVERYPFSGFFNPFLTQAYDGVKGIIDVGSVSVSWGGSVRPSLDWAPWDDFQAYYRSYNNLVSSDPWVWSVMDDGPNGEVWMFPTPSQAGDIELDCYAIPSYLYSDDDYDAIPDGMKQAVQYGAAELAMLSKEKYSQAAYFGEQMAMSMGTARVAFDRGKSTTYYG